MIFRKQFTYKSLSLSACLLLTSLLLASCSSRESANAPAPEQLPPPSPNTEQPQASEDELARQDALRARVESESSQRAEIDDRAMAEARAEAMARAASGTNLESAADKGVKDAIDDLFQNPPSKEAAPTAANPNAEDPNYTRMNVFFATDRKRSETDDLKDYFGGERGEVSYGMTTVSIPRDHRMGELEAPSLWRMEFREDPEKHVVMLEINTMNKDDFFGELSDTVDDSDKKNAFILVHGYNVTFEAAARRTAQISYDIAFDGAATFYSWPSQGSTSKYTFDEANIKWSEANLAVFLKDFAERSEADNIYLVAHSMGNRALTRAYITLMEENPELRSKFKEVILAAPDIDAEVFKRDIAPKMVEAGNPITLYASSGDKALLASKAVHGGYLRAGDSGENILKIAGIESIDSSSVETSFLGHSYYGDETSVISDMFYILNHGFRAHERIGIRAVSNDDGTHWEFKN